MNIKASIIFIKSLIFCIIFYFVTFDIINCEILDILMPMRKLFKISILTFILVICLGGIALGIYFSSIWHAASANPLNLDKLADASLEIELFDSENKPIKEANTFNNAYISLSELPKHAVDAFISIEDKQFYNHSGVNFKRMAGAMLNNLKSKRFKEGASTITQQLIKNTHLTSEKTMQRKIKEIALSKKLENSWDKDKILETYLNVIYFGNNCYGIENAAQFYFSKSGHDLTIDESALLAGLIKSPNKYSPIKNIDNAKSRRNLVLDEMVKDGKLSAQEGFLAKNKKVELSLNKEKKNKLNSYSQASIDEACKILAMPAKQIALHGYKIYTYQDEAKQNSLDKSISSVNAQENDHAGIVIDNSKAAVVAYCGTSPYKILDAKRQPGSCLKPLLVYGPALNEDIIYPCTQLLDEKTTISGYSPKNVSGNYKGYVSAREALSKSINIPAVKVLSYVGIEKAKAYATMLGIKFDEADDSFALALGGMNYGTDLKTLAGAYSCFANGGKYSSPSFISHITDKNNKLIYIHERENKIVMREDACYLLTDMLKTCAQTGTARKLSDLNMEIASKTGTTGKPNSSLNLDAWNISYTKNYTYGAWIGNLDNTPISIVGGNQPTEIIKNYLKTQRDDSVFDTPTCITTEKIDSGELIQNHRIVLANNYTPEKYCQEELFSRFNLPHDISTKFVSLEEIEVKAKVEEDNAKFTLDCNDYLTYEVWKEDKLLDTISAFQGKKELSFAMQNEREDFEVRAFYPNSKQEYESKKISLVKANKNSHNNRKWFI